MNLIALPAFSEKYFWTLHDGHRAVVVDPGESAPAIQALDPHELQLAAILVTLHHADLVDGVDELRSRVQGSVHGLRRERIPPLARTVEPINHALADQVECCEAQRTVGEPTLPSSMASEGRVTRFCTAPSLRSHSRHTLMARRPPTLRWCPPPFANGSTKSDDVFHAPH